MHGYRTQYYIESVGQSKSLKKWTSFKSSFLKNCHLFYFYFETTEILLFAYRIRENTFRTEIWLRFILSLRTGTDNSLFLFFFLNVVPTTGWHSPVCQEDVRNWERREEAEGEGCGGRESRTEIRFMTEGSGPEGLAWWRLESNSPDRPCNKIQTSVTWYHRWYKQFRKSSDFELPTYRTRANWVLA